VLALPRFLRTSDVRARVVSNARYHSVFALLSAISLLLMGCGGGVAVSVTNTSGQSLAAGLTALDFVDPHHGWAVGVKEKQAVLLRTTDGRSWQTVNLPVDGWPRDVEFVDRWHGWIEVELSAKQGKSAEAAVLRTSDGGLSWRSTSIPRVSIYQGGLFFLDTHKGWFVGAKRDLRVPVVLRTQDGGATWRRVQATQQLVTLTSIVFVDSRRGWISGYDNQHIGTPTAALSTRDGGRTWRTVTSDTAPHSNLVRLDARHLWSLGERGYNVVMLRLSDVSSRWEPLTEGGRTPSLFTFATADIGWGIHFDTGEEGSVADWQFMRTEDGGRTWTDCKVKIPTQPVAIEGLSADVAVVGTDAGSILRVETD